MRLSNYTAIIDIKNKYWNVKCEWHMYYPLPTPPEKTNTCMSVRALYVKVRILYR